MIELTGKIVSVHSGSNDDLSKEAHASIDVQLDGIVGDRHRSYIRETWPGDKQPLGTTRRNERQWSAVSVEELLDIQQRMGLEGTMTAGSLGANLCIKGIAELSRLPKGTILTFPSGCTLMVEEYNPPCKHISEIQAKVHTTISGTPLSPTAFSIASKLSRGVVGVVEAAGVINAGDDVVVTIYETPSWLIRTAD
ncbi:MAG: MOSC domain-containing protein [Proteobacteria bacterium]|nr:MOSC domain-containing protein [Pseudomonadota bacterium]